MALCASAMLGWPMDLNYKGLFNFSIKEIIRLAIVSLYIQYYIHTYIYLFKFRCLCKTICLDCMSYHEDSICFATDSVLIDIIT